LRKGTARPTSETRVWTFPQNEKVDNFEEGFNQLGFNLPQAELKVEGWRFERAEVLRLLEKLKLAGTALGEYVGDRFYRGILTGSNEAFVVDRATRDRLVGGHKSSIDLLKPFVRGRDVKRWYVENPDLWLCYVGWNCDIDKYPAIYAHLQRFRKLLKKRPEVKRGTVPWYALSRYAADYWEEFDGAKILYQEIATFQAFAFDESGTYSNNKTYIIPCSDLSLLGILNSRLVWWFLHQVCSKLQGGALAMQTPYVSQVPIPSTANWQKEMIVKLVEYILFLTKNDAVHHKLYINYFESIINALVYELFLEGELHTANKHFFDPLAAESLPSLSDCSGEELKVISKLFDRLSARDHVIRRNLHFLNELESVRIIEDIE
jgi:adenine-specific DNA-methyltransferase